MDKIGIAKKSLPAFVAENSKSTRLQAPTFLPFKRRRRLTRFVHANLRHWPPNSNLKSSSHAKQAEQKNPKSKTLKKSAASGPKSQKDQISNTRTKGFGVNYLRPIFDTTYWMRHSHAELSGEIELLQIAKLNQSAMGLGQLSSSSRSVTVKIKIINPAMEVLGRRNNYINCL